MFSAWTAPIMGVLELEAVGKPDGEVGACGEVEAGASAPQADREPGRTNQCPGLAQGRAPFGAGADEDFARLGRAGAQVAGPAGLYDARLLGCDQLDGVAEPFGVLELDGRDHARRGA